MRIAINTGGGDAPGLNAVIRAVVLCARSRGWEVLGVRKGYEGFWMEDGLVPLDERSVRGITHRGGTILGTTNRGSPFARRERAADGAVRTVDRSDQVIERAAEVGIDGLIAVGGDGSLRIALELARKGLKVIGVPKTIDNDLGGTKTTFGFQTAVHTATEAIDKLHSTTESHERVMVVELMGRHAGWIALYAGFAATADAILIPEIPYDIQSIVRKIKRRWRASRRFAIVVVAEGAVPLGGRPSFLDKDRRRLGGAGRRVAAALESETGRETRSLVLGHLQRGGKPIAYDRILALRFGAAAVSIAEAGEFGSMVALENMEMTAVPLAEAVACRKSVPLDHDIVAAARALGIVFGDEKAEGRSPEG